MGPSNSDEQWVGSDGDRAGWTRARRRDHLRGRPREGQPHRRLEGSTATHADAVIAVEPLWVQAGEQEPRQAQHAVEELLALASPPTAIFSGDNPNTEGVVRALHAAETTGVEEPSRIPVVSFDNFEL